MMVSCSCFLKFIVSATLDNKWNTLKLYFSIVYLQTDFEYNSERTFNLVSLSIITMEMIQ